MKEKTKIHRQRARDKVTGRKRQREKKKKELKRNSNKERGIKETMNTCSKHEQEERRKTRKAIHVYLVTPSREGRWHFKKKAC